MLLWAAAPPRLLLLGQGALELTPRLSAPWPPMATRRLSMATMECIARLYCIGHVSLQVPDAMS